MSVRRTACSSSFRSARCCRIRISTCSPPNGRLQHYFVELDNSTERLQTNKDVESWQRKLRLYETLRDQQEEPFRVLIVTTRSSQRMRNILALARDLVRNPQRPLFFAVYLPTYLQERLVVTMPLFHPHHQPGQQVPLVDADRSQQVRPQTVAMTSAA